MDYEGSMLEPSMAAAAAGGFDLDGTFEPQTRARSNTWPCPRPEEPGSVNESGGTPPHQQPGSGSGASGLLPVKKNSSRRNAWGNLSYADLITQAITSSADKRLTLSQIYEWMVQHVPYFKDKGDSNSSAGWKNSIRHNLSLHNRFMRVQNEGTGKSSWWMINPDAKPGKSARRRATSMETSKFEKRRGRVKKKVEAMRNGGVLPLDATPSPSSSVSEGLDQFPDSPLHPASNFQLSPDFRPRASSNASSCGRLSPIPAVIGEAEWTGTYANPYSPEQLAGSLAESMKLVPGYPMYQTSPSSQQQQSQPQPQPQPQQSQQQQPPPSYYETQFQRSNALRSTGSAYGLPPTPQPASNAQGYCMVNNIVSGMSPSYQQTDSMSPGGYQQTDCMSPGSYQNDASQQYLMQDQSPQQQPQSAQQPRSPPQQAVTTTTQPQTSTTTTAPSQQPANGGSVSPIPSTMMGQLMGALNNSALLDDLNINIESFSGFDCDIDEVIQHELQINGTLDINFQQGLVPGGLENNLLPSTVESLNAGLGMDASGVGVVHHPVAAASAANVAAAGMASNAASAAAVYASTNAATPASASPSWVH